MNYEHYVTPKSAYEPIIEWLGKRMTPASVLDPCSGTEVLLDAAKNRWPHVRRYGYDIQERFGTGITRVRDSLDGQEWIRTNLAIMNPPFSKAQRFLEAALSQPYDAVACLIRLSFLAGKCREDLWKSNPTCRILVLGKRPSFKGGKTDNSEYCWAVWGFGNGWERIP